MKRFLHLSLLLIFASLACVKTMPSTEPPSSVDLTPSPAIDEYRSYTLIFYEEFAQNSLEADKWETQLEWGRTNGAELQYYAPNAFLFQDGKLRIVAENQQTIAEKPYTSGAIATYHSFHFTYGYIEARIRVPSGKGLWPALWLLDLEGSADEIDIMEILGDDPQTIYMTLHYPGTPKSNEIGGSYSGTDFSSDYHLISVSWSPDAVLWYVDGIERYRVTEHIPSRPMYLIINLAVGGNWPGEPDEKTKFPAYFDIDYVRVYQEKDSTLTP